MHGGPMATYGIGTVSTGYAPPLMPENLEICRAGYSPGLVKDIRARGLGLDCWDLVVRAGPEYAGTKFRLTAWNPTGDNYDLDEFALTTVVLWKGRNIEWVFDPRLNGTSQNPQFAKEYDILPGQEIAGFRITDWLPEPSPLVALFAGLGGLAWRRKGRRRKGT
jgi:hypothetical protein